MTVEEGSLPIPDDIQRRIQGFGLVDDVWSTEFLTSLVVQTTGPKSNTTLVNELTNALSQLAHVHTVHVAHVASSAPQLPQGPYFLNNGRLHHAYRLYPDTAGAFVVATVPAGDDNTFRSLDASAYGEQYPSTLTVAVSSRLYFTKTKDKPYAGLRLAIKDIMDLKGFKTGASFLAYTALHPPRPASAETIQRLVNLGFVIVGKVKTTQLLTANGRRATGSITMDHLIPVGTDISRRVGAALAVPRRLRPTTGLISPSAPTVGLLLTLAPSWLPAASEANSHACQLSEASELLQQRRASSECGRRWAVQASAASYHIARTSI